MGGDGRRLGQFQPEKTQGWKTKGQMKKRHEILGKEGGVQSEENGGALKVE